ncbi:asparagine synthase (glutamine-hydrolyzing) [Deminuibacter soli]|uniref:asparagine synthase (glutamine-hydrolyzing) n=1 Tax=Deminuibacter soli TaxID=2291815 RepID=A0A3E1NQI8_9BACT|nr:asparagine synthase (glutamine-hydrolyzing) [Deminuibacter soli]RFM30180.1 asparagine synthase (glutamine-hydrolyzing) [Deminuibacter soli]
MCGIAGFCDFKKNTGTDVLQHMTDALTHRGPNDAGYKVFEASNAAVGLGQRRLSILDLSSNGHQPMIYEHLSMVFNGEVYNFKEIRLELEQKGYTFNSWSDTEVILKGYHCWGDNVVHKLIGMFVYVIFDSKRQELTICRDRAGVKPLYYFWNGNVLLFGSELKAFHQHPAFTKEIDINSLSLFLQYSYIPAPYTIYKKTCKLNPGHYFKLSLTNRFFSETKYWDVTDYYNKPRLQINEADAMAEVERLMISAYEYRMVADVPVGVFLSGGYDSSSVAAILQHNRTERLKTFTIGFEEAGFNEADEAKKIAAYLGTDHHEWYIKASDAADVFHDLPEIYDEPFADNSVVPTALVSKLARQHVKVSLSADGGDEIFAGYNKFNQSIRYTSGMPSFMQGALSNIMYYINPDHIPYFNKKYNFATRYKKMQKIWADKTPLSAMKYISQYITEDEARGFIRPEHECYKTHFDNGSRLSGNLDSLNKMLAIDYKTFLVDNNLVKVDRATMHVGLEGREPMLDHRLIEFVAQLPACMKIQQHTNKYLLKKIVHKYIPKEMMDRPKMPFIAPLKVWFKDELKEKVQYYLGEAKLKETGMFQVESVKKLTEEYLAGKQVNYQKVWNLLVFQLWYERWNKTQAA